MGPGPYKISEGQLLNGAHPSIGGDCLWGAKYIGGQKLTNAAGFRPSMQNV
jgi:hypothetical protein